MNRQSELLKNIDWLSIFLYTLLVFMGWLNIYAAVYDESHSNILDIDLKYGKQLLWIGAAFVLGIFILLTDSKFFTAFSFVIYGLTVGLLAAVLVFGVESHGARSWFEIGGIRIQPAEFGKFATCLAIANVMSRHGFKIMRFSSLALIGLLLAIPAGLIVLQNDTWFTSIIMFYSYSYFYIHPDLSPHRRIISDYCRDVDSLPVLPSE